MSVDFTIPNLSNSPPGGFSYTVPETNHTVSHFDWRTFRDRLESHCLANNVNLAPDWEARVIDEMCKRNGPLWRKHCKRGRYQSGKLSVGAMMTFLRTMKNWVGSIAEGEQALVPPEEAERRASICATCPHNVEITLGCGSCMGKISKGVQAILGTKETPHSKSCGQCGLCGCVINAAVWVSLQPQQDALDEEAKKQFRETPWCWKAQGL